MGMYINFGLNEYSKVVNFCWQSQKLSLKGSPGIFLRTKKKKNKCNYYLQEGGFGGFGVPQDKQPCFSPWEHDSKNNPENSFHQYEGQEGIWELLA